MCYNITLPQEDQREISNKRPIEADVLPLSLANETCRHYLSLNPQQHKDPERAGFEAVSDDVARVERSKLIKRVVGSDHLTRKQRGTLRHLLEVLPVLRDADGGVIFGLTSRNRGISASKLEVTSSTIGRYRAKLVDACLIARVDRHYDADPKRRWFLYAINVPAIRKLPQSDALQDEVKTVNIKAAKTNPFERMHPKSKKLYVAVANKPDQTLASYAKSLACDRQTVRRVRDPLLENGALIAAGSKQSGQATGRSLKANRAFAPKLWPAVHSDVIDEDEPAILNVSDPETLTSNLTSKTQELNVSELRALMYQDTYQNCAQNARMSNKGESAPFIDDTAPMADGVKDPCQDLSFDVAGHDLKPSTQSTGREPFEPEAQSRKIKSIAEAAPRDQVTSKAVTPKLGAKPDIQSTGKAPQTFQEWWRQNHVRGESIFVAHARTRLAGIEVSALRVIEKAPPEAREWQLVTAREVLRPANHLHEPSERHPAMSVAQVFELAARGSSR